MHDRNGVTLQVGDIVQLTARITEIQTAEDYCNAQLLIGHEKAHGPDNVQSRVTINTRQVVLLQRGV